MTLAFISARVVVMQLTLQAQQNCTSATAEAPLAASFHLRPVPVLPVERNDAGLHLSQGDQRTLAPREGLHWQQIHQRLDSSTVTMFGRRVWVCLRAVWGKARLHAPRASLRVLMLHWLLLRDSFLCTCKQWTRCDAGAAVTGRQVCRRCWV